MIVKSLVTITKMWNQLSSRRSQSTLCLAYISKAVEHQQAYQISVQISAQNKLAKSSHRLKSEVYLDTPSVYIYFLKRDIQIFNNKGISVDTSKTHFALGLHNNVLAHSKTKRSESTKVFASSC